MAAVEGTLAEGTAVADAGGSVKDAPSQMVPLARVEEMRKDWMAEAQARFNPELDRQRNAAVKRAEAAEKKAEEALERLQEAEEKSSAYETAREPESLRRALAQARRAAEEAAAIRAQAERGLLEAEEAKAEARLQRKYHVDDEWIEARKKAGKTPLEIVDEAASQFYLKQTGGSAAKPQAKGTEMPSEIRGGSSQTFEQLTSVDTRGFSPAQRMAHKAALEALTHVKT